MDGPSGPEPQSYNRAEIGPYYAQRSSCDDLPRPDYLYERKFENLQKGRHVCFAKLAAQKFVIKSCSQPI